jgi:hypothetical protein
MACGRAKASWVFFLAAIGADQAEVEASFCEAILTASNKNRFP